MESAEKTSAAAASARAAETKEKADGCSLRRSRGYLVHNPLICGDTLSCCVLIKYVFRRQKKKPQILNDDDTWADILKAAPEEVYYSQQPLLSERRARAAWAHNRQRTAEGSWVSSQVATAALRGRCSGVAWRSSTLDRTSPEQNGTFRSLGVVDCSVRVLACVLGCHGNLCRQRRTSLKSSGDKSAFAGFGSGVSWVLSKVILTSSGLEWWLCRAPSPLYGRALHMVTRPCRSPGRVAHMSRTLN